jgi:hypothetical protein
VSFNGFISYSHAADGRLAPAVQRGLHQLAKPWHRRRALWIFRDQTGLAVTPGLWSSIQEALDGSEWFVLLASPEAARSQWVNKEIEHWLATKPAQRILPVVTGGEWHWDPVTGDFAADSSAVPPALRGAFAEEPLFLDLRWARNDQHLNLRHSRFRDAIAQLAAPMHGMSKDELEGEDVRQHRVVGRVRAAAVTTVVALGLVASFAGVVAVRNGEKATAAAADSLRHQRVAAEQKGNAEKFASEARVQEANAEQQEKRARDAAAEARRQEENARRQGENARRQQELADRAAVRAREQEQLATQQRVAAQRAAGDAGRAKKDALRQERLAREAAQDASRQRTLADEQRQLADMAAKEAARQTQIAEQQRREAEKATAEARKQEANADRHLRVAIGRRLVNHAKTVIGDDPKTALMLGLAAQKVQPGAKPNPELTGLITSTRYAGTIPKTQAGSPVYSSKGVLATIDVGRITVSLWNVADRAKPVLLGTVPSGDADAELVDLAWSPDGRILAVGDGRGDATLWDVASPRSPRRLAVIPGYDWGAHWVHFSPDGKTVAKGAEGGGVVLWDVAIPAQPKLLSTLAIEGEWLAQVVFGSGGTLVTHNHNTIRI